jgi:hypothetical protein
MSRLQDELSKRATKPGYTQAEQDTMERFNKRVSSLQTLLKNKDFKEYLKLEEEMNDPKIVIAHDCSDSTCMALKRKVRDFWNRKKVLDKVTNGTSSSPKPNTLR